MSTSKLKFLVFFTKCGFSLEFGQSLKPYMLKKLQFCFLKVYSFLFPLRKEKEKEKKEEKLFVPTAYIDAVCWHECEAIRWFEVSLSIS